MLNKTIKPRKKFYRKALNQRSFFFLKEFTYFSNNFDYFLKEFLH